MCKAMKNFISQKDYSTDMSRNMKNINMDFSMLLQWKLMSTLRALGKSALHRGWTARTSKSSAISHVKGKAAFWASQHVLRLRTHFTSLSLNQTLIEILKTFLGSIKITGVKNLSTFQIIKYYIFKTCNSV